jgi:copper chaperone NosL
MKLLNRRSLILLGIVGSVWIAGCAPEPRPIRYGQEGCQFCKMTLAEKSFGGELVTRKGKVYVFDDLNCLLSFYNSTGHDELAYTLVVDYEHPGEFLNAGETFFVKSEALRSPMAGNVAAFKSYDRAIRFKQEKGGILLGWAEVTTQFK